MKRIGRQVLLLPTGQGNPRNGEGAFLRLKDGSILFCYTEYVGDCWADHASAHLACYRSRDEGESWGEHRILIEKPESAKNVMSVSLMRMANGDIGLFYIRKNADGTDTICLARSQDEGEHFAEPIECLSCLERQDYYVLNNDRILRLRSGRLLMPLARHSIYEADHAFAPGVICFLVSDDDGRSWRKTEQELIPPSEFTATGNGYEEPGLYQFENGEIWCYIRTSFGRQFQAFSRDGGESWSGVRSHPFFTSPDSPMLVKRFGARTFAVFNPYARSYHTPHQELWGRTPLALAVSTDDGRSFTREQTLLLEEDDTNSYCYPALIEGEGYLLCAYYHSNNTGRVLNATKIVKITEQELACALSR